MRLGIMQPYFFPNLAHFYLICNVDKWVVFDVTQYTPKSWMSRNRILHSNSGWQYINAPLSNSSICIKTHEAQLVCVDQAKEKLLGKLFHYKKNAIFYNDVIGLVGGIFDGCRSDKLVDLNYLALKSVCEYLDIEVDMTLCSRLGIEFPSDMKPGDWAPYICQNLNATEYINPVGGQDLFDVEAFNEVGVKLFFAEFLERKYEVRNYNFEEGLSILDVMMWLPPNEIRNLLKNGNLIAANTL